MIINLNTTKYSEARQQLINFLKNEVPDSPWKDFDFTNGSNIDFAMAPYLWLFLYYAWYMNVSINEAFIDSVQLKKNILSIAKMLGYKPYRKTPAIVGGTLRFSKVKWEKFIDNNVEIITVPAGSKFRDDKGLIWQTSESVNLVYDETNETWSNDIVLYQGLYKIIEGIIDYSNNSQFRLKIFDRDVANYSRDEKFFQVQVETGEFKDDEPVWETYKEDSIFEAAGPEDSVFFVDEFEDFIEFKFGDGVFGKKPIAGLRYKIEYFVTSGKKGNGSKVFTYNDEITFLNKPDLVVGLNDLFFDLFTDENGNEIYSSGGAEDEDIESIRVNAPKFFATKGRAVTTKDYEVLINSRGLDTYDISVWGGKYNIPVLPNIFVSGYFREKEVVETGGTEFDNNFPFKFWSLPTVDGRSTGEVAIIEDYIANFSADSSEMIFTNPLFIFNEFHIIGFEQEKNLSTDLRIEIDKVLKEYFWGELQIEDGESFYARTTGIQKFQTFFSYSRILTKIDIIDGLINAEIEWKTYFRIYSWMKDYLPDLIKSDIKPDAYNYNYYICLPEIEFDSLAWYDLPIEIDNQMVDFNQAIISDENGIIYYKTNINDVGTEIGLIEKFVRNNQVQSVIKFNIERFGYEFPIDLREVKFYFKTRGKKWYNLREQIPYLDSNDIIFEA